MDIDTGKIDEVVLALLQLSLHDGVRAWKGHDWDALDILKRLAERRLAGETSSLCLSPGMECIEPRLAPGLSRSPALIDGLAFDIGLERIEQLRAVVRGEALLPATEAIEIV